MSNDPRIIGPGIWSMLHSQGYLAKTAARKANFRQLIADTRRTFPCHDCRGHFGSFIDGRGWENYEDEHGYFRWSWEAHNHANRITGKTEYPYELALAETIRNIESPCTDCLVDLAVMPSFDTPLSELMPKNLALDVRRYQQYSQPKLRTKDNPLLKRK